MNRREYFFDLIRLKQLTSICAERRRSYNPVSSTAVDDRAICSQMEADLLTLHMKVKFWEQQNTLFVRTESAKSTKKKTALKEDAPEASKSLVEQPQQSLGYADDLSSAEIQLAPESL